MKTIALILLLTFPIFGQSSDLDRAIELYRAGNTASAIVILERLGKGDLKDDPRVWNYLGLAYSKLDDQVLAEKHLAKAAKLAPTNATIVTNYGYVILLQNKTGKAIDVLSKAIKLDPKNSAASVLRASAFYREWKFEDALRDSETAISLEPGFATAYSLKANILVGLFGSKVKGDAPSDSEIDLLRGAVAVLEKCIATCTNDSEVDRQKNQIGGFRKFLEYFNAGERLEPESAATDTNSTPVRITRVQRPEYTNAARLNNVSGKVRILALFDSDGVVRLGIIVKSLGYGLDEEALRAALQTKFVPATRNGQPVAVVKFLEFGFGIY